MGGPPGAPRAGSTPAVSAGPPGAAATVGITTPRPTRAPEAEKEKATTAPAEEKKPGLGLLASFLKVENAGNVVNLASDLIASGVNPFLSRLPKPLKPETDSPAPNTTAAPAPPPDPLSAVKLLGIVYSPKMPIALIAVDEAKYPSQVVRPGDVVALPEGQATIGRITQTSMDLLLTAPSKEKRTMVLPDIVGYGRGPKTEANPSLEELPGEGPNGKTPESDKNGNTLAPKASPERQKAESAKNGRQLAPSESPDGRKMDDKMPPSSSAGEGQGDLGAKLGNLKRLAAGVMGANAGLTEH